MDLNILHKPLSYKLIYFYYSFIVILGIFQILGGSPTKHLLNSIIDSTQAWFLIPLAVVGVIGISRGNKKGLKITFGAQLLFFLFVILHSGGWVFFRTHPFIAPRIAAILHTFLNLIILVYLFKKLNFVAPIQQTAQVEKEQIPSGTELLKSQLNSQYVLQKVILGFLTLIGWGTATNWVFLRFFFDSPTAIQRATEGLAGIGLLFTFGIGGLVGAVISISLFSFFLSRKNLKSALLSNIISIFITAPLGFFVIYPIFSLLIPFVGIPYVDYPHYEAFLPVLPSLLFVIALNLFPIFLGYSFLYKKWLPIFLGLVLILISTGYFLISYQGFDSEAREKSGVPKTDKPIYLPQDSQKVQARDNQRQADVGYIRNGLKLHYNENGSYPVSLNELSPKYMPLVPIDPSTNQPYQYQLQQNGADYKICTQLEFVKDQKCFTSQFQL